MRSTAKRLLGGAVILGLPLFWIAAHAQVSRLQGANRPRGIIENRLAKFDSEGGLQSSNVADDGAEVLVNTFMHSPYRISVSETSLEGLVGESTSSAGVRGSSTSDVGVKGTSQQNHGILGISASQFGVRGETETSTGVGGLATEGNGIGGGSDGASGVFGIGKRAGVFAGAVLVDGDLAVSGLKLFRIDHPLDPENRYLVHAALESPEALNVYSGNITTDHRGKAVVQLPSYFSVINRDFRYQLTVIGQFAQAIVAEEIANDRFAIQTDKPNVKVSWQVIAARHDPWARAHPLEVEQVKPEDERGTYQHPELFDQPEEKSLAWKLNPDLVRAMRELRSRKR